MKTNKAYSKIITTRKELTFFKKISETQLQCEASRNVYYRSGGLYLKLNKSVSIVPLQKESLGWIIYMSNSVLSVGEFLYISDKEFEQLKELNLELDKEQEFAGWRHFWYKDDIIAEFVNPIEALQIDLRKIKSERNSLTDRIEREEVKEKELLKRFI